MRPALIVTCLATLVGCGDSDPLATSDDASSPTDAALFPDGAVPGGDGAVLLDGGTPADQSIFPVDQAVIPVDQAVGFDATTPPPPDLSIPDLQLPPSLVFHAIGEVVDASPDDTDNIWAVTFDALHILPAGKTQWRRYTNADGLHIYSYINSVAAGGSNEGWVGLEGFESDYPDNDSFALKRVGKAEHVRLASDGSISSLHYSEMHNDNGDFWHTRSARRLLYAHRGPNAGHLFLGSNHGIVNVLNDSWGDHIHAGVYYQPENSLAVGDWYGLAIDPGTGGLWTCGLYACGLQRFYADPRTWVNGVYQWGFTVFTSSHDLNVPHGYKESHVGVAVSPGGRAWFLSRTQGLASWDPATGNYMTTQRHTVAGLGTGVDVVADPDGTIWVADTTHVIRFDPRNNTASPLTLPSSDVRRLYMDTTRTPRALYISTGSGLAIYRGP